MSEDRPRVSDNRKEDEYSYTDESGRTKTVRLVEFPTVDDIMALGVQAAILQVTSDIKYTSVVDYDVVSKLVRVHMPVER